MKSAQSAETVTPAKPKSTAQKLSPVAGVPGLYAHENGTFYGKKKQSGKKHVAPLLTDKGEKITDKKLAVKALWNWFESLANPTPKDAGMPFGALIEKLAATYAGKEERTQEKIVWFRRCFEIDGAHLLKTPINKILPSDLAEFFAIRAKSLGHYAFNDMGRLIRSAFAIAVGDGLLSENPYDKVPKNIKRKKIVREPADVPTVEQCDKICLHVRNQEFADTAELSADMLEFMHKAALGQAECILADWSKVNWKGGFIEVKRKKTGAYFRVPIYPHMKAFLLDMWERQGKPKAGPLFSIKSPKQALYNACRRLKFKDYSPIDFRKARIVWMLRRGVPVEMLAKWQGHKDNGVLIRRTYSWVISEMDNAYEQEQLQKLSAPGKRQKKAAQA